jgi:hypothetical protein
LKRPSNCTGLPWNLPEVRATIRLPHFCYRAPNYPSLRPPQTPPQHSILMHILIGQMLHMPVLEDNVPGQRTVIIWVSANCPSLQKGCIWYPQFLKGQGRRTGIGSGQLLLLCGHSLCYSRTLQFISGLVVMGGCGSVESMGSCGWLCSLRVLLGVRYWSASILVMEGVGEGWEFSGLDETFPCWGPLRKTLNSRLFTWICDSLGLLCCRAEGLKGTGSLDTGPHLSEHS